MVAFNTFDYLRRAVMEVQVGASRTKLIPRGEGCNTPDFHKGFIVYFI